ncbi:putative glucan endo-1,3-beta-D-glucosidase [Helianthus debilis subsp. tardiflorus]
MTIIIFIFLLLLPLIGSADQDAFVGVNIGTALSDMPNPTQTVVLLKSQNIRHVRLYDADRAMLFALANTGIHVTVSVPNQQLLDGADVKMLQAALDWACGPGKVNCSMMLQGQPCYEPDTVAAHATYAFNTYYHRMGMADGTCDFNGVATVTTTDPSSGDCTFLGSGGGNGTITNGTSLAPSTNSTTSGSLSLCNSISFFDLAQALVLFAVFL